jgi:hypothetical protein
METKEKYKGSMKQRVDNSLDKLTKRKGRHKLIKLEVKRGVL